jgi:hypothetical protein
MSNRDFRALAQQWRDLDASGIPLEPLEYRVGVDSRTSGSDLTIRQGRDAWASEIRELKNGRFAYILPVFIRRDRPGKTIIRECWISPPWMDTEIELLEDPKMEGNHPEWYDFPGDVERLFRETVVNHRVNCNLPRGEIREGLLLAVGSRPPESWKNGEKITVTFTVMDQWDQEHQAKMQMRMNRLPARVQESYKPTRSPLLSVRDVITPGRPSFPPALPAPPLPKPVSRKKKAEAVRRLKKEVARLGAELGYKKMVI